MLALPYTTSHFKITTNLNPTWCMFQMTLYAITVRKSISNSSSKITPTIFILSFCLVHLYWEPCSTRYSTPYSSPSPSNFRLVDWYTLMYLRAILDWFFQVRIDWEFLESSFLNLAKNQDLEVGFGNYWSCSMNMVYDLKTFFL